MAIVTLGRNASVTPNDSATMRQTVTALDRLLIDSNPEVRRFATNILTSVQNLGISS